MLDPKYSRKKSRAPASCGIGNEKSSHGTRCSAYSCAYSTILMTKKAPPSKLWVPVTMFTCLALGVIVIGGNYLGLLPGGEASNNFLIIGLVLLVAGFVLSTFLR